MTTDLTRIPSYNTRFAKVKFRLKTSQLKTLLDSSPEGDLIWGHCAGVVIQGELFRGNCPWWGGGGGWCQLSWGEFYEGKLSGGSYPGGIVTDFRLTKEYENETIMCHTDIMCWTVSHLYVTYHQRKRFVTTPVRYRHCAELYRSCVDGRHIWYETSDNR